MAGFLWVFSTWGHYLYHSCFIIPAQKCHGFFKEISHSAHFPPELFFLLLSVGVFAASPLQTSLSGCCSSGGISVFPEGPHLM